MTAAPGLEFIHRFVPAGPAGDGFTLLLLHGTGGTEQDLLPVGRELMPGAALLSPRGKVLENGMPRFFRRLAEGVFDLEDLKRRTEELARFIEDASLAYGIDRSKLIAAGYSNGANIAGSLLLTHPGAIAGAVLFRAMVPFVPEVSPNLRDCAVMLAAGRRDPIATPQQTLALQQILEKAGARVSLHWHLGGHELGQDDLLAAKEWLRSFN